MAVEASTLEARLSPEKRDSLRKLRWVNRLTSAWAPVAVLGLSFILYLFIVELHTPSAAWAQPAEKVFGLLMVAWLLAIVVARTVIQPFARLRHLRHQGWELLDDVVRIARRHRDAIPARSYEEVLASCAALSDSMLGNEPDKLEEQLKATHAVVDKQLVRWRKQSTLDFAMGFVKALAIALAIRSVLLEPFKIPSGSMIPTLEIGDQIFVNKFIYGVQIPFTTWVPFKILRAPRRGDVIVFKNPADESKPFLERKDFIKRVVGVGGDRIELIDEVVHVNGVPQPRELIDPSYTAWDEQGGEWDSTRLQLWRENLDGHPHLTAQDPRRPADPLQGPYIVPEGHVFVLGDNRDNSADSRVGFGANPPMSVPLGNIKGKAMVIWLALGHGGLGSGVFDGTGLVTERLFQPVR